MKIAILGTRGIPNNYGGFEQCAESLSIGLVKEGIRLQYIIPISIRLKKIIIKG